MVESLPQPDLDPTATGQLIGALAHVMPALEQLVKAWKKLVPELSTNNPPSTCGPCPQQETGTNPRGSIRQCLPSIHRSRNRRENLTGLYPDTLHEIKDRRCLDVFAEYEACSEIFTAGQWEVIYLYWNQGLTQAEIAKELGLKRSAVSGRLTRAATRKEQYDKRMRQEQLDHLKKMQKESWE